ncbi:hypothetical protein OPT61_g7525 [Boeremia exigua]|uniref:Uncharacterized protein n=1 Tax=Boeremia exigua TaxID=749465 RepID=A0ACC2I262_9PLEO|nr:hypothetical protein OPT61_g7525 [Boeremia exigua]
MTQPFTSRFENFHINTEGQSNVHVGNNVYHAPPPATLVQRCLQSLFFSEMHLKRENINTPTAGTCTWLIENDDYLAWEQSTSGTLWIRGAPGVGKSTLMDFAISDLDLRQSETSASDVNPGDTNPEAITLVHFFRGDGVELERSLEGLARCLLFQLLSRFSTHLPTLLQDFKRKCDALEQHEQKDVKIRWGAAKLLRLLEISLREVCEVVRVRMFIDAVDECAEDDAERTLNMFQRLVRWASEGVPGVSERQIALCYSCRNDAFVEHHTDPTIDVQECNSNDIRRYIEEYFQQENLPLRRHDTETLVEHIDALAKGLFVWVILVLPKITGHVRSGKSVSEVIALSNQLPRGLNALYRKIVTRLRDNHAAQSLKLFQWLCFGEIPWKDIFLECENPKQEARGLNLKSLRVFMNLDVSRQSLPSLDEELPSTHILDGCMAEQIQTLSGGLACSTEGVGLIHGSVRRFMLAEGFFLLDNSLDSHGAIYGQSHSRLGEACIAFLNASMIGNTGELEEEPSLTKFPDDEEAPLDPLGADARRYAITHAFAHASKAEYQGYTQDLFFTRLHPLCDRESAWTWYLHQEYPDMLDLWFIFQDQDNDVDAADDARPSEKIYLSVGRSLFVILAAMYNVPGLLLQLIKEEISMLPGGVLHAITSGGMDPNDLLKSHTLRFGMILHITFRCAVGEGFTRVVEVLLENGCAPELQDDDETALLDAVQSDYVAIVKLLVRHGANINRTNERGYTALSYAISSPEDTSYETCRELISLRADVNFRHGDHGKTPLHFAVEQGSPELIRLLLRSGANANVRSNKKLTMTLQVLVRGVAKPLPIYSFDNTPLEDAICGIECSFEVVKALLEGGAEVGNATDDGTSAIVQYTMERIEEIRSEDGVSWAKEEEREEEREKLLQDLEAVLLLLQSYPPSLHSSIPLRARTPPPPAPAPQSLWETFKSIF